MGLTDAPLGSELPATPLLDLLVNSSALIDDAGVIRRVNTALVTHSGYTSDDLVGHPVIEFVPDWNPSLHKLETSHTLMLRMILPSHEEIPVVVTLLPLTLEGGEWFVATMYSTMLDHGTDTAVADAERRFALAFQTSMAPMNLIDLNQRIIDVNESFCAMVGRPRAELLGQTSVFFTHPDDLDVTRQMHDRLTSGELDRARYVKRYVHSDGHLITTEVSKAAARDVNGNVLYFVVSQRDVTAERELSDRLRYLALHDALTGLANRTLFDDRFSVALQRAARAARADNVGAVLMLDLDGFKSVNDTYGHLVGNTLLRQIAERFAAVTRATDTLCRFGGDEFLYLAEGLSSSDEAEFVADRLRAVLDEPFSIGGLNLAVRVSIGIAVWDQHATDQEVIVRAADAALYEAKHDGRDRRVTHCVA